MDEEENNEEVKKPDKEDSLAANAMLAENSPLISLLAKASSRSAMDGKGPLPKQINVVSDNRDGDWEWDGVVDEDAHMGLD